CRGNLETSADECACFGTQRRRLTPAHTVRAHSRWESFSRHRKGRPMKSKIVSVNFSKAGIDHAASVLDNVRWKPDGGFTARCPAHDDRRNSLSVSEGDRGKLLAYCHAGCS